MMINVKRIMFAGLAAALTVTAAFAAEKAVEIPKDLVKVKPFVSTAKAGFPTTNESTAIRNTMSKVQAYKNVNVLPVAGWVFSMKGSPKDAKPEADVSGWEKVTLPHEWKAEGAGGWYRATFTVPETVNGFAYSGGSLTLILDGGATLDVFVNGNRVKGYTVGKEIDLADAAAPGDSIVVAVKVTALTGNGTLRGARLHAAALDPIADTAGALQNKLEDARMIIDQLTEKQKALISAVGSVSKEIDALKGVSDIAKAKAAFEKMKGSLSMLDGLLAKYPVFNAGPYLMNLKKDQVTVGWETRVPALSVVYYGKDGLTNVVSDPTPVTFHKVVLKGLTPQTEYKYMAVTNKLASQVYTFKSAINRDTPFKFVVWSDDQSNPQIFEPLVDLMITRKPDIGLSTGDQVGRGGDYEGWAREFFYPLRRLISTTPYYVAIGNHEYGGYSCGKPVEWFEKYNDLQNPDGYYYAFTYGNSRFIMFNQQAETGCPGIVPGSKQYEWLLKELESPEYKAADFHFMFMHKPPYSDCWSGGYYDGEPSVRSYVVPLMEKYGVDIVFSGHTHDYEHGQWPQPGGPHYVITGGAGGGLDDTQYKDWPQIQMYKFIHHFSFVTINGKTLKYEAVGDDGKVFDSFEIKK